jgi:membrane protease YdiL (CAAX protease family)
MTEDVSRRPPSLRLIGAALATYSLAHLFNNTVLELPAARHALSQLQIASGGWIEPLLVRSWVVLALFLGVVLGFGRRRFADLGWRARHVVPGLLIYLGAWSTLQLGLVAAVLRQQVALEFHPMWTRFGLPAVLGGVLAQYCGHALVEDTAFRGFVLPALRARVTRRNSLVVVSVLVLFAVVVSALLFGLAHLPTLVLTRGTSVKELVLQQGSFLSAGIALGLAYVATRNLVAVVGLHVLLNDPAPIVAVPGEVLNRATLVVFAGLVVLGFAHRLRRARRLRRAQGAATEVRKAA